MFQESKPKNESWFHVNGSMYVGLRIDEDDMMRIDEDDMILMVYERHVISGAGYVKRTRKWFPKTISYGSTLCFVEVSGVAVWRSLRLKQN